PDLGTLERSRADQTIIDDPAQEPGALPACRSGDHKAPACDDQCRSNGGATDHAVYNTVTTSDGSIGTAMAEQTTTTPVTTLSGGEALTRSTVRDFLERAVPP